MWNSIIERQRWRRPFFTVYLKKATHFGLWHSWWHQSLFRMDTPLICNFFLCGRHQLELLFVWTGQSYFLARCHFHGIFSHSSNPPVLHGRSRPDKGTTQTRHLRLVLLIKNDFSEGWRRHHRTLPSEMWWTVERISNAIGITKNSSFVDCVVNDMKPIHFPFLRWIHLCGRWQRRFRELVPTVTLMSVRGFSHRCRMHFIYYSTI